MLIYVDRGHRTDGGATDEWRQCGVFVDALCKYLSDSGHTVVRTPDELDSFVAQSWALDNHDGVTSALYLACHVNVGAKQGLTFYSSPTGRRFSDMIATGMPYKTTSLPTSTPGYERTPSCLARITASPKPICGVLLELWSTTPTPTDEAIREVALAVSDSLEGE